MQLAQKAYTRSDLNLRLMVWRVICVACRHKTLTKATGHLLHLNSFRYKVKITQTVCHRHDRDTSWSLFLAPLEKAGMVWSERTPACPRTCQTIGRILEDSCLTNVYPGYSCPSGMFLEGAAACVSPQQCPCTYQQHKYDPASTISIDCNDWYKNVTFFLISNFNAISDFDNMATNGQIIIYFSILFKFYG